MPGSCTAYKGFTVNLVKAQDHKTTKQIATAKANSLEENVLSWIAKARGEKCC